MPADYGDKTEAPTPRRRQEARERGQVARSAELTAAVVLLGGIVGLRFFGTPLAGVLLSTVQLLLGDPGDVSTHGHDLPRLHMQLLTALAGAAGPLLITLLVLAAAVNFVQIGPMFVADPLQPKLSRINPLAGFSRLFSMQSAAQLAINLIKLLLVGLVAWREIHGNTAAMLAAAEFDERQFLAAGGQLCYDLGLKLGLLLLLLAIFDYAYRRWQHERDLRMTKEEIKEEMRRMEGDPVLKHRRRQIQMQMAKQRLRKDVPRADVVVTNPTELAIALKYDEKTMPAPTVLAKGAGVLAAHIRALAAEHGIPIIERKPLAQALYKTVEVGQAIPAHLYKAVAEILAYVYELNGRARRRISA